jgi:hypothetical protein
VWLTWGLCHLQSLLCDPNPNSPANSEAARMFSENKREYNRKVREVVEHSWTADWWCPVLRRAVLRSCSLRPASVHSIPKKENGKAELSCCCFRCPVSRRLLLYEHFTFLCCIWNTNLIISSIVATSYLIWNFLRENKNVLLGWLFHDQPGCCTKLWYLFQLILNLNCSPS